MKIRLLCQCKHFCSYPRHASRRAQSRSAVCAPRQASHKALQILHGLALVHQVHLPPATLLLQLRVLPFQQTRHQSAQSQNAIEVECRVRSATLGSCRGTHTIMKPVCPRGPFSEGLLDLHVGQRLKSFRKLRSNNSHAIGQSRPLCTRHPVRADASNNALALRLLHSPCHDG